MGIQNLLLGILEEVPAAGIHPIVLSGRPLIHRAIALGASRPAALVRHGVLAVEERRHAAEDLPTILKSERKTKKQNKILKQKQKTLRTK